METQLNKAFKNIRELDPPEILGGRILSTIRKESERKIRIKLALSRLGLVGSLATIFYTGITFGAGFFASEFWAMVSLVFTDAVVVAGNGGAFAMSLLENFPVVAAIALVAPVFTLLVSLNAYINIRHNNHKYVYA